jgi:Ni,Fe-hydrogenase I large subunit
MTRVVIDPVTRIQGHLRVTCEIEPVPGGWVVTDAHNTATLFRGLEKVLTGRDPRDAPHVASRICGVCPTAHALCSAKAIEAAFGMETVPNNARLVRNMTEAAEIAYDHILWFYQLNLPDYVDVAVAARDARPTLPSLVRLQDTLRAMTTAGGLGPLAGGLPGHPAYDLPPDAGLELLAHYLEALAVQAKAAQAAATLGGKFPMAMNAAPGGVTHLPQLPEILAYRSRMAEVAAFIDGVMMEDLALLLEHYGGRLAASGRGWRNYLSWGVLDAESQDPYDRLFPRGALLDGDPHRQTTDPSQVRVYTGRSWYPDELGRGKPPLDVGQWPASFTSQDDLKGKYDWTRAVRLGPEDSPMETGPLAQVVLAYLARRREVVALVDRISRRLGSSGVRSRDAWPTKDLAAWTSDLGRLAARVVKAKVVADNALSWADVLTSSIAGRDREFLTPAPIPDEAEGSAGWDGPRGALSHWVRIQAGRIGTYAVVAPSNWNLSPRDDQGRRGTLEEALVGTRLAEPGRPLEILRTVRSFDPCMACAVHVIEPVEAS